MNNAASDEEAETTRMARRDLELKLLRIRFRHYTPNLQQSISRTVIEKRCEHTSDTVIDELWGVCPDEISALLTKRGISDRASKDQNHLEPSTEARELIRTYIDGARNYEGELSVLEDDDFEALYRSIVDPIVKAKRDRRTQSAQERDRWAFFNEPEADADFARWRGRPLFPEQAVALSFGKDPDVVSPESLRPYRRVSHSPFREAFKDRLDLIEGAVAAGELSVPMAVSAFAQWATARGLAPPPELTGEAAVVMGKDAAFWKEKYESAQSTLEMLRRSVDDMWPKSRASIYMMIIGMAIARFEHKTNGNTRATSTIKKDLEDLNLNISEDTILGHLRDAASELEIVQPEAILWSGVKRPKR